MTRAAARAGELDLARGVPIRFDGRATVAAAEPHAPVRGYQRLRRGGQRLLRRRAALGSYVGVVVLSITAAVILVMSGQ